MNFSDFIRGDNKEAVMMKVMDKVQREQLRTLALAARTGEWKPYNSTTILALLDRIDELEGDAEYTGWYCSHCQRGVDATEVTYHEQHEVCGRVITNDRPPPTERAVPEGWRVDPHTYLAQLLARVHRDGGHYVSEHGVAKAVEEADTIIAKLYAAERAVPEWQPIETAPEDGIILICGTGSAGYFVSDAKVESGMFLMFDHGRDCHCVPCCSPTHWMPLPAPPAGDSHE